FLGVQILLAAGLARRVLHELERGAVDAVARAERRRERRARHERRAPAGLQILVQDVRRVRPEVRPEVVARAGELREVVRELLFRVAPREVRVRLAEAELREPIHYARPTERLGEE